MKQSAVAVLTLDSLAEIFELDKYTLYVLLLVLDLDILLNDEVSLLLGFF